MREVGGSAIRTGLAGFVVGAGVCYCVYRVVSKTRRNNGGVAAAPPAAETERERAPQGSREAPGSSERHGVFPSPPRRDSASLREGCVDLPNSSHDLKACHIQNLIHLLESTEDPSVQEQILITLSNSAAFSVNQDLIRNLGGLSVVGKMLSVPDTDVKEKALNTLNNLSMNIKNQEVLKVYITRVCEEIDSSPLNSELQLAGLRFLTNMSVTNNYHCMMTSSIPCFLHLLSKENERTQVQVLKVLVNLSANTAMTKDLLNAQAPFLLSLLDGSINKEVLLRFLLFATNLTKNMKKEKNTTVSQYNEDSIFSVLWGNSTLCAQKLAALLYHHDTEIREQVAELIMQQG
nr:armadillo repeat-containing protein 10 [Pogona vitticeps]